jgi:hypothetical protein
MTSQNPNQPVDKTTEDELKTSRRSLEALFPDGLDPEAEDLINEVIRHCNPPIKVVTESTWALKFGGLVHCAVCEEIHEVRVELPREQGGLCDEHAEWKIFYVHHSWSPTERRQATLERLMKWRDCGPAPQDG